MFNYVYAVFISEIMDLRVDLVLCLLKKWGIGGLGLEKVNKMDFAVIK